MAHGHKTHDDEVSVEAAPRPPPSRAALAVFVVVLVVVLALTVQMLASFFAATVLALVLVALSSPLHARVKARVKNDTLAAGLVTTALLVVVILPFMGFVIALVQQIVTLVRSSSESVIADEIVQLLRGEGMVAERLRASLGGVGFDFSAEDLAAFVDDILKSGLSFAYARVSSLFSDTLVFIVHFSVMAVLIAAFLYDGPRLKRFMFDLSPLPDDEEELLVRRFDEMARAVFLGNGLASGLQGVMGGIGFALFDVGPSIVWGAIIAVLAFLPLVGASVIFLPAALYLMLKVGFGTAFLYVLYNMLYVGVLEYGLKPRLIGDRAAMPAVLVFMGIVAGIAAWGILGLFLGPFILTVFLTLVDLWRARYRAHLFDENTAREP